MHTIRHDKAYSIVNLKIINHVPKIITTIFGSISKLRYALLQEKEFEDTKGVMRICNSKKDRQHNVQKKKYKRTNNDLQNIHIKLKIE